MDDAFSLCWSGRQRHGADVGPCFCLETSKSMVDEESLVVWQTFLHHLAHWRAILTAKGCLSSKGLNRMTIHLTTPLLAKHNKKGKGSRKEHVTNLLMVELLKAMEAAGHNETILKAKEKFKVLMAGGEGSVDPDELEQVYRIGVREGGSQEWNWCWKRYTETNVPSERNVLLKALAQSKDMSTLGKYLNMTLGQEQGKVKNQDVPTIIAAVAANPLGGPLAWNHLRSHWSHFFSLFGSDRSMGDIISSVTGHFSTSRDLGPMLQFFKDRDAGAGNPVLQQTIETVQVILMWIIIFG